MESTKTENNDDDFEGFFPPERLMIPMNLHIVERINADGHPRGSKTTYIGKLFMYKDLIMLRRVRGEQDSIILRILHDAGLTNVIRTPRMKGDMVTEVFYDCHIEQEIEVDNDAYKKVATVYKRLIDLGIVVGLCKFVRYGPRKVWMQLPMELTMYLSQNRKDMVNCAYYKNEFIKNSIPAEMKYKKLIKFIWNRTEIAKLEEMCKE